MSLSAPSKGHECKYWKINAKWHYRQCGFCYRRQYNYTGEWKNEITLTQFIYNWAELKGTNFEPTMTIKCAQVFEMMTYEGWDEAFTVELQGQEFGPFLNLNQADKKLREYFGDHKPWELFNPKNREVIS